jgi:hypothetical protein
MAKINYSIEGGSKSEQSRRYSAISWGSTRFAFYLFSLSSPSLEVPKSCLCAFPCALNYLGLKPPCPKDVRLSPLWNIPLKAPPPEEAHVEGPW